MGIDESQVKNILNSIKDKGTESAVAQGGMTLGEMITKMERHLSSDWESWNEARVELEDGCGLDNPHSYRGYYHRLALEPKRGSTDARELVRTLRGCLGETFMGYKGGNYTMHKDTLIHVADYGSCGLLVVGVEYVSKDKWDGKFVVKTVEEQW